MQAAIPPFRNLLVPDLSRFQRKLLAVCIVLSLAYHETSLVRTLVIHSSGDLDHVIHIDAGERTHFNRLVGSFR
jgi:hypothetical protein